MEIEDLQGRLVAKGLATFYLKRAAVEPRPGARAAMIPEVDGPEPED